MTIGVMATCWAQAFRPDVTESIRRLGESLNLDISVPEQQTCCGLPAREAGQLQAALVAARHTLDVFDGYDVVVTPSPSCLRMLKEHIPTLMAGHPDSHAARALAERSYEWGEYLLREVGVEQLGLTFDGAITYFSSCQQEDDETIRLLLANVEGATLIPPPTRQCCGFGNNLSFRYPEVSQAIARPVVTALRLSRADLVIADDVGCLLQLAPILKRAGGPDIQHMAEFLAQSAG